MCFGFLHKPILLKRAGSHVFFFSGFSSRPDPMIIFPFHVFLITSNLSNDVATMADPFRIPLGAFDSIEVTALFAWENRLMKCFDPPRCGNAIRCRSMTWLNETNSYESYRGLPQSHIDKAVPSCSSSFPSKVFCIWVLIAFCLGFWFRSTSPRGREIETDRQNFFAYNAEILPSHLSF